VVGPQFCLSIFARSKRSTTVRKSTYTDMILFEEWFIVYPLIYKSWIMETYGCCKPLVVKTKVSDVRIQMLGFSDFENGCMQGSFLKRMHARVSLGTNARNQKGHFNGCTQRTFGQRMCARYGAISLQCGENDTLDCRSLFKSPATSCRALLQETTYKDISYEVIKATSINMASYANGSLPHCTVIAKKYPLFPIGSYYVMMVVAFTSFKEGT